MLKIALGELTTLPQTP